ncbi:TetR/AcrR family transcriptional regulator [Arthrobacter sp. W4I7]|uniref:TetR/AcrR family transcriptional regulator n=1 Tax=Arthrobacter sp. W4I7 TaxID=3042296 RepID=UPI00278B59E7|nr:TetR/AcrR family transcriptional regulator [Arthrobacter sp. W4I7]MDQ0691341.1 AcrR family transcriptional regulator [Arthrobacter sp. W4I7]
MSSRSHDAILQSAGRLFGERGYRAVTVRDIAGDAGVSAALVMKLFQSKEKLYAAVQPDDSLLAEPDVPTSELGRALVFRVLMRRERSMQEPWANIPLAVLNSPNPDAARADIHERYLDTITQLIGDATQDRRFASTVIALMTGFGEAIRTLGLFDSWDVDELVGHYGAIVQIQIDASKAATQTGAPSPD